jgi:hypothetical protein
VRVATSRPLVVDGAIRHLLDLRLVLEEVPEAV